MMIFRNLTTVRTLCLTVVFYSAIVTLPEANTGEKTEGNPSTQSAASRRGSLLKVAPHGQTTEMPQALPVKFPFEPVSAVILADRVNIRAGCGTKFEVIGQLDKTADVQVTGKENGWYKIRLPEDIFAFVHKDYVNTDKVTANRLHARAGAGINYSSLGILEKGQPFVIVGQQGDWLKIVPPEKCFGWVREDLLCLAPSDEKSVFPDKAPLPVIILEEKKRTQDNSGKKLPAGRKAEVKTSEQGNEIEVTGTILEIGRIVGRSATHKLMQGRQVAYYLKSTAANLNYFVYQEVTVAGTLEKNTAAPYPVINVVRIIPKQ